MRSAFKNYIMAALATVTLAGCSNNDHELTVSKDCPEFTAGIGRAHSRAVDSQWEEGDMIGITGSERTNVCYNTEDGDGVFNVATSGDQIYFQDDNEATFNAYYPWNNLDSETSAIVANTADQTLQKTFDFLWAQATGKKAQPNVNFNFAHSMAKVVFTIKAGKGVSAEELKTVLLSMGGFRHTGTFNITDGTATVDDNEAAEKWQFAGDDKTVSYLTLSDNELVCSLILLPQKFEEPLSFFASLAENDLAAKIDFTGANSEKDGDDAENEWVAGRQYNLTLTLNRTQITLDGCVINQWNEVKGDDIVVD